MPLVFVHGINVRRGDTAAEQKVFDNRMESLRQQFRATSLGDRVTADDGLRVFLPYWGDLGATFARGLACLPHSGIQKLAVGDAASGPLLEVTAASLDGKTLENPALARQPLLTLARARGLGAAIDLLFAGTATAPVSSILLGAAALKTAQAEAAQLARRAEIYAAENPRPAWLDAVADDSAFLNRLLQEVEAFGGPAGAPAVQALGLGGDLKKLLQNGVGAVKGAVGKIVNAATGAAANVAVEGARDGFLWLSGFARPTVSTFVGRFLGDIITYMENRGPILDRVLADVDRAVAAKRPGDDELILVGHSFGGIILYDILSHFRPELQCDLFLTVGSQVALFAEIGRLADKAGTAAGFAAGAKSTIPRPRNTARWVNIFDRTDIIGFGTEGVFSGAWDFEFETDTLPIISHGAYFDTVRFHARLRARVAEAFAGPTGTDLPRSRASG